MVRVTHHGYQRARERFNIRGKSDMQKLIKLVRKNGKKFSDISEGPLKSFIYKKSKISKDTYYYSDGLKTTKGYIYYVYCNFLFVFKEKKYQGFKFITTYPIPDEIVEKDNTHQFKKLINKTRSFNQFNDLICDPISNQLFQHRNVLAVNLQNTHELKNKKLKGKKSKILNYLNDYLQYNEFKFNCEPEKSINLNYYNQLNQTQLLQLYDLLFVNSKFISNQVEERLQLLRHHQFI